MRVCVIFWRLCLTIVAAKEHHNKVATALAYEYNNRIFSHLPANILGVDTATLVLAFYTNCNT